jgi:hypothetical protein
MTAPPCTKHGICGIADERILAVLGAASLAADRALSAHIESMIDFDDQLWTTWRSPADRDALALHIDRAWADGGGSRGTLHLIRSNEDYDYQEDCMNEAASASGKAGEI